MKTCKQCGKEIPPNSRSKSFCPPPRKNVQSACAVKWHNDKRRLNIRMRSNKAYECKCPKCNTVFLRELEYKWIGRGMPRMFCRECKDRLFGYNGRRDYSEREGGLAW